MKVLRLFSDATKTYAQIIFNEQKFDVFFENGCLRFNPVLETVDSKILSAPPETGTDEVTSLTNLLEAMEYVIRRDIGTAIISPMAKIEHINPYMTEWTLEPNWKSGT